MTPDSVTQADPDREEDSQESIIIELEDSSASLQLQQSDSQRAFVSLDLDADRQPQTVAIPPSPPPVPANSTVSVRADASIVEKQPIEIVESDKPPYETIDVRRLREGVTEDPRLRETRIAALLARVDAMQSSLNVYVKECMSDLCKAIKANYMQIDTSLCTGIMTGQKFIKSQIHLLTQALDAELYDGYALLTKNTVRGESFEAIKANVINDMQRTLRAALPLEDHDVDRLVTRLAVLRLWSKTMAKMNEDLSTLTTFQLIDNKPRDATDEDSGSQGVNWDEVLVENTSKELSIPNMPKQHPPTHGERGQQPRLLQRIGQRISQWVSSLRSTAV